MVSKPDPIKDELLGKIDSTIIVIQTAVLRGQIEEVGGGEVVDELLDARSAVARLTTIIKREKAVKT